MIHTRVGIKAWLSRTPAVDEVRPTHCVGCGSASRPAGASLVLHGHGLLMRQVRGVLDVGEPPNIVVVPVRRYACQRCDAVMTVVPAGMLARRQYWGPAIAYALYLWVIAGLSDRRVREAACGWQLRGRSPRGWAQLYRWTRAAARLFALPRPIAVARDVRETAQRVLITLSALAPVGLHDAPLVHQIFQGTLLMP